MRRSLLLSLLILFLSAIFIWKNSTQLPRSAFDTPKRALDHCILKGATMGTTYCIRYRSSKEVPDQFEIQRLVENELREIDRQLSTYRNDSEISQFNDSRSLEWIPVSIGTAKVVSHALEISEASSGAFDITVGPLVNLWGFGPDGRRDTIPSPMEVDSVRAKVGYRNLRVRLEPPALKKLLSEVSIDLSAIGPGYGVDRISELLESRGIEHSFVEIGGEIAARGYRIDKESWQVGLEAPQFHKRSIQRVVSLNDRSLATSGNYRNFYELDGSRFSHTIDPFTGRPVSDSLTSASAIADKCADADAIATCMMALGSEKGLQLAEKKGWPVLLTLCDDEKLISIFSSSFEALYPDVCRDIKREID